MRVLTILLLTAGLLLGGCASSDKQAESQTGKQIYQMAAKQLDSGNFDLAIKNLQLLEARFPFGPYAEQAQLDLIYAHYRNFENAAAIEAANRFIRLHPQHPDVDYAYYMRGLANFTEGRGLFERFVASDPTERDPGNAREAFTDFAELLRRFPSSEYAPDARARMIYLRNLLARHEINVANYYLKRRAFLAAANRGRYVLEHYPRTPAVPDALAIMVQAYKLLDMDQLADSTLAVLRKNYPNDPNLDKNGNFVSVFTAEGAKPGWLARLTFGLFGRANPPEINHKERAFQ